MMQKLAILNIPMCLPIEFGLCNDEKIVYSLQSFIDGDEAEKILPELSKEEQYKFGITAGEILKKIHSIEAPSNQELWSSKFNRKATNNINKYKKCGIFTKGDNKFINYIEENRHLLDNRPQFFQHGDYHIGNMIISTEGRQLTIIDFNRFDFGDPWEEFNRVVWSAQLSTEFASGIINSYFEGNIPIEFWKLLALYISSNSLSSIS